jgi:hypothetical protein
MAIITLDALITGEATLPSVKPSDLVEAFVMMETISTPGRLPGNLAVDGSLDKFCHFSFQYVTGADFHSGRDCFKPFRDIASQPSKRRRPHRTTLRPSNSGLYVPTATRASTLPRGASFRAGCLWWWVRTFSARPRSPSWILTAWTRSSWADSTMLPVPAIRSWSQRAMPVGIFPPFGASDRACPTP